MSVHERAGQKALASDLTNIPRLVSQYYVKEPTEKSMVSFGTSGHRGSALNGSFTEVHIAAICQALAEYRKENKITGPMYIGMDTHALSECAFITAIEVLVANEVEVIVQSGRGYTPTPVISNLILCHNRDQTEHLADGIVITPSHNPPEDGGFKYNPPNGGPADSSITSRIEDRANAIIRNHSESVRALSFDQAWASPFVSEQDFVQPYIDQLGDVVDMAAIAKAGIRIGVDPLGGAAVEYWDKIATTYGINIEVVNNAVDPSFAFMSLDKDGKIRMDCSSPYAMAGLIELRGRFDIAFANDPDTDRHGIVAPSSGLMNPNHYLAVAIHYLMTHRKQWANTLSVGKTLVSSAIIDRVVASLGRDLVEVPVGFKWFVDGLFSGECAFGGEESAGASFLRRDGGVWSTDKDGIILSLLAAEICAVTGKDPGQYYQDLTQEFGAPIYTRIDASASQTEKQALLALKPSDVDERTLAGEDITQILTEAPGNGAAIGGLKVVTENGWFAARPSGTEEIYKVYAESFLGEVHLARILEEAQALVTKALSAA